MQTQSPMLARIHHWAEQKPNEPALLDMQPDGNWAIQDWTTFHSRVQAFARGLIDMGVQPGDRVAMIAKNRSEWLICQHGIAAVRAICCPIYTTNLAHQVAHIIDSCGAEILILDEQLQLDKLRQAQADGTAAIKQVISMDVVASAPDATSLKEIEARGTAEHQPELDRRLAEIGPDDVTMLIFTSGTTGLPKGAQITYRGVNAIMDGTNAVFGGALGDGPHRTVSYLPLCHAAEQVFTNYLGLSVGASIHFCREMPELKDHLAAARPTYLLGIPRVWEKFENAMRAQFAQTKGVKSRLMSWARSVELACVQKELKTGKPHWPRQRKVAHKLVISKILKNLGLDDLKLAASGAAPIATESLWFFASIGILIHEGFGMTETSGLAVTQPVKGVRIGTIGKTIPGVEARIDSTGELLFRGENMVQSYFGLPQESADLWQDGWMRTGDLASMDDDGFITVTGRIKELIITAGGKNVGPVEIEEHMLQITGIGQAIAVGDRRPYLVALMVLEPEMLPELLQRSGAPTNLSLKEATRHPAVNSFVRQQLEKKCNSKLARYLQIKYFALLNEPFTEESGELTPTQKLKRPKVLEQRADIIDALYKPVQQKVSA